MKKDNLAWLKLFAFLGMICFITFISSLAFNALDYFGEADKVVFVLAICISVLLYDRIFKE